MGGPEEGEIAFEIGAEEVCVVVRCSGDVDQRCCYVDDLDIWMEVVNIHIPLEWL